MIIIVKYNCNDNNTTTTNKDNYIGYSNGSKDKTLFRKWTRISEKRRIKSERSTRQNIFT